MALMATLLCIAAPLTVPIGPVPVSMATLAVYLAGALLGAKRGALAVALYIMVGAVGIPVFSGFRGGFHHLAGVTGGYFVGYVLCAWIVGFCADRWGNRRWCYPVSMVAGTALCYGVGMLWFMFQTKLGIGESLAVCVLPFLPGDAIKIIVGCAVAPVLRRRLRQ